MTEHCKYLCQYHIIWCPKFRYRILNDEVVLFLKKLIYEISKKYEYEIIEMEIMEDHVHLFVGAKPCVSPLDIVKIFKSISTIKIFNEFPEIKKFYSRSGSLWSRSKFISTIGVVSAETVKKYIQGQKDQ